MAFLQLMTMLAFIILKILVVFAYKICIFRQELVFFQYTYKLLICVYFDFLDEYYTTVVLILFCFKDSFVIEKSFSVGMY